MPDLPASTWATVFYLVEWLICLGMLFVVPFRRSPQSAQAWLLLTFFAPVVGLIVFSLFGHTTYPRWRTARFGRLSEVFDPVRARLAQSPHLTPASLPEHLQAAARLVQRLGSFPSLGGNRVELLADYDGSIARLVQDIDDARHHVHLLFYILTDDPVGQNVLAALERAARRGVTCRVLIDALGSRAWAGRIEARLGAAGVRVRRLLPLGLFNWRAARVDLRNHRKVAIIDGRIGFTGSQNIVDKVYKPGIVYEEMVARVTGPVVLELQGVFATDWFVETGEVLAAPELFPSDPPEPPDTAGPGVVAQVLPSGPDYPTTGVQHLIVALIHGARERVCITTPYFIPDESLLVALHTAVLRGVEVHLIVSRKSDQLLVGLAQRSYYGELLRVGVRIHRYRDRFLHAKHLSVDGAVSLIGSSNIDIRSFQLNAEVSLLFYDRGVAALQREHEERYLRHADLLTPAEWDARPLPLKVLQNLARLLSSLL